MDYKKAYDYKIVLWSEYDTVSDVVESKVHQCQQNSDT